MTIMHIVLFKLKSSLDEAIVQEACTRMLNLAHECIHPSTSKPYIVRSSGGRDNSPEGLQGGFTHGFVVEFASTADRDYYVKEDKAHRGFVEWAIGQGYLEEARVVDYEVGVL